MLIVEDIVDSGVTLNKIKEMLLERKPASLRFCTLLRKPDCLKVNIHVDFVGFGAAPALSTTHLLGMSV